MCIRDRHKTSLVAEQLLIKVIQRARELLLNKEELKCSNTLLHFLKRSCSSDFNKETLVLFSQLDDVDILAALKIWQSHSDFVLSKMAAMLLNRDLLKITIQDKPLSQELVLKKKAWVKTNYNLSDKALDYFVFSGRISNTCLLYTSPSPTRPY